MRSMILSADKKKWKKAVIVLIVLVGMLHWRVQILDVISIIGDRDAIAGLLQQYGILGPVVLSLILGLQVFLAVIPGHAFIVAGGYIYGFAMGTLITQISTVIASQLAFLLTRRYGRSLVGRLAPEYVIDHWNKLARTQGGLFIFFSFILPIFPNDLMCFIAGLSELSPRKFFLANFFGRLPCAVFVTLIGSHGFEMPLYVWVLIALVMIVLCILLKYFSTRFEKMFFHNKPVTKCVYCKI